MRPARLRDAEVEHARDAVDADEDVLRRDVAVDDAERLAVLVSSPRARRAGRGARRHDRARRSCSGMRAPARRAARSRRESDSPCDVLHDEEELALGRDDVERRHDVRVADARGEPRLVEEHRDELGILRELRVQPLDRDGAREAARRAGARGGPSPCRPRRSRRRARSGRSRAAATASIHLRA